MSKFLIVSLFLLAVVTGFVIYQSRKNPDKARENQIILSEASRSVIPGEVEPIFESTAEAVLPKLKSWSTPPTMIIDKEKSYIATIATSEGTMSFELNTRETPLTVNNFAFLAKNDFYNGTIFHRIIRDFMIQGGDPQGTGMGGPGYKFADEAVTREYVRGTLAMANSGSNTNGSQFFVMIKDTPLPKNYTIFGKLISGDEVLQKIAETPVTANSQGETSKPTKKVTVETITISEK